MSKGEGQKKLRIGIIGAGRIGRIHADNLLREGKAEVVAISDPFVDEALQTWALERGIATVTKQAEDWLTNEEIDAIFICSPTDTHVDMIIKAANAGKHIFCEKPISMSVAETERALAAVHTAGVRLQVGFNRRFDHNFRRVRELVGSGEVGTPHVIKITSRDPAPPSETYVKSSGGIFMDMMIHDFDMARFVSGLEAEEISAVGSVLVDPLFERCGDVDTAIVTIRFAGGAIGVIDNSRQAVYGYDQRVEVFGSAGSVAVSNDYPNTAVVHTAAGVRSDLPLHFFLERYNGAYIDEVKQFVDSIIDNEPIIVNGEDGLQAERMALAAKLSLQLGRPIRMEELSALVNS